MTYSHHHPQSSRQEQIVVHTLLAEMTPDEAKAWIRAIRARLVRKQERERTYLDRRARRGVHTPTDDVYEDDQQLENDILALLDEMLAIEIVSRCGEQHNKARSHERGTSEVKASACRTW